MTISIESLLAARLFLSPKLLGNRLFFLSNLGQGGHLSLYAMDAGGSIPEPLLPARIALQNPDLIDGESFVLFPKLSKILLMLDQDGDENYQPMLIPLRGASQSQPSAQHSMAIGSTVLIVTHSATWSISMQSRAPSSCMSLSRQIWQPGNWSSWVSTPGAALSMGLMPTIQGRSW